MYIFSNDLVLQGTLLETVFLYNNTSRSEEEQASVATPTMRQKRWIALSLYLSRISRIRRK
jgi:hypothetical protein